MTETCYSDNMPSKHPPKRRVWGLEDFEAEYILPEAPGERVDLKE